MRPLAVNKGAIVKQIGFMYHLSECDSALAFKRRRFTTGSYHVPSVICVWLGTLLRLWRGDLKFRLRMKPIQQRRPHILSGALELNATDYTTYATQK